MLAMLPRLSSSRYQVVKVTLRSGVKCLTNLKSLSSYLYIDSKIKTLGAIFDQI